MDPRDTEHVKAFEAELAKWTDHRFISADQLRTLAMYNLYIVNLFDFQGWVYRGHSWKEGKPLGCLVVKGVVDDIPSVVFTNAATTISGMRIFLRKMEGEYLEWVPDKYA